MKITNNLAAWGITSQQFVDKFNKIEIQPSVIKQYDGDQTKMFNTIGEAVVSSVARIFPILQQVPLLGKDVTTGEFFLKESTRNYTVEMVLWGIHNRIYNDNFFERSVESSMTTSNVNISQSNTNWVWLRDVFGMDCMTAGTLSELDKYEVLTCDTSYGQRGDLIFKGLDENLVLATRFMTDQALLDLLVNDLENSSPFKTGLINGLKTDPAFIAATKGKDGVGVLSPEDEKKINDAYQKASNAKVDAQTLTPLVQANTDEINKLKANSGSKLEDTLSTDASQSSSANSFIINGNADTDALPIGSQMSVNLESPTSGSPVDGNQVFITNAAGAEFHVFYKDTGQSNHVSYNDIKTDVGNPSKWLNIVKEASTNPQINGPVWILEGVTTKNVPSKASGTHKVAIFSTAIPFAPTANGKGNYRAITDAVDYTEIEDQTGYSAAEITKLFASGQEIIGIIGFTDDAADVDYITPGSVVANPFANAEFNDVNYNTYAIGNNSSDRSIKNSFDVNFRLQFGKIAMDMRMSAKQPTNAGSWLPTNLYLQGFYFAPILPDYLGKEEAKKLFLSQSPTAQEARNFIENIEVSDVIGEHYVDKTGSNLDDGEKASLRTELKVVESTNFNFPLTSDAHIKLLEIPNGAEHFGYTITGAYSIQNFNKGDLTTSNNFSMYIAKSAGADTLSVNIKSDATGGTSTDGFSIMYQGDEIWLHYAQHNAPGHMTIFNVISNETGAAVQITKPAIGTPSGTLHKVISYYSIDERTIFLENNSWIKIKDNSVSPVGSGIIKGKEVYSINFGGGSGTRMTLLSTGHDISDVLKMKIYYDQHFNLWIHTQPYPSTMTVGTGSGMDIIKVYEIQQTEPAGLTLIPTIEYVTK